MDGFSLVVRISADHTTVERLIAARAPDQEPLDPELAVMMVRAGLGLILSPAVSFIYANPDETIVVLRRESVHEVGQSLEVHDHLISSWAARMAQISGESLPICGRVYEFPDMGVVRKAIRTAMDAYEEQTLQRSAMRLGAQLRGRGEPFHASMVETLEEQSHLLRDNGIDVDALPAWWWRGVAARASTIHDPNQVEIWGQLPASEKLSALIA
jgi:tRNA(His) 5'-end guanylyltransferase